MDNNLKYRVRVIGNKDLGASSSTLTLEALVRDMMLPELQLLTKWQARLRTTRAQENNTQERELLIDVCAWARTVVEARKRTCEDLIIRGRAVMVGTLGSCMRADASKQHRLVHEGDLLKLVLIDEASMVQCGDGVGGLTLLRKALDDNATLVLLGDASQEGPLPWTVAGGSNAMAAKHDGNASLLQVLLKRYPARAEVRNRGRRLRPLASKFVTALSRLVLQNTYKPIQWPELIPRPEEKEDNKWPEIQATLAAPRKTTLIDITQIMLTLTMIEPTGAGQCTRLV